MMLFKKQMQPPAGYGNVQYRILLPFLQTSYIKTEPLMLREV